MAGQRKTIVWVLVICTFLLVGRILVVEERSMSLQDVASSIDLTSKNSPPSSPPVVSPVAEAEEGHHEHSEIEQPLIVITTMITGEIEKMREFVGSMHKLRSNNLDIHTVIIYGFGLTSREIREMSLWRSVEVINGFESAYLGHKPVTPDQVEVSLPSPTEARSSPELILNLIELNLRKFGSVLFMQNDYLFTQDSLHDIASHIDENGYVLLATDDQVDKIKKAEDKQVDYWNFPALGFQFARKSSHVFVSFQLQCLRGYHCDPKFRSKLMEKQRELIKEQLEPISARQISHYGGSGGSLFCSLLLRDDVLYSFEYVPPTTPIDSSDDRVVVALGMPTLSVKDLKNFDEVSPIRIFIRDFLTSISNHEWANYRYVMYMGFDEGDKYFDNPSARKDIDIKLKSILQEHQQAVVGQVNPTGKHKNNYCSVTFAYVKFPYSKGWVTYLWNGLFVTAIKNKADYFYQVNDDLSFKTAGWTSKFVDELKQLGGVGVVGPHDPVHGNGLLTQAMVSRKHYEIFGRLYPLDIKDWYSDNWITDVYGDRRRTINDISVQNVNDKGTRYTVCMQPGYNHILDVGKEILADWISDQSETLKPEDRFTRELNHGPIIQ